MDEAGSPSSIEMDDEEGGAEGGAADAERLESIINREIVCFPERSAEKESTPDGVCSWHSH